MDQGFFNRADRIYHCVHLADKRQDLISDFSGGLVRFFSQLLDFLCHDREAFSSLSGTGGFNACIQGQQVGFFSNICNIFRNASDLLRCFICGGYLPADFSDRISGRPAAGQKVIEDAGAVLEQVCHMAGKRADGMDLA